MIDDSDGDFVLLAGGGGGGGLLFLAFVALLAIGIYVIASSNAEGCAARHCDHGVAKLLDHECVCVEKPTPEAP